MVIDVFYFRNHPTEYLLELNTCTTDVHHTHPPQTDTTDRHHRQTPQTDTTDKHGRKACKANMKEKHDA